MKFIIPDHYINTFLLPDEDGIFPTDIVNLSHLEWLDPDDARIFFDFASAEKHCEFLIEKYDAVARRKYRSLRKIDRPLFDCDVGGSFGYNWLTLSEHCALFGTSPEAYLERVLRNPRRNLPSIDESISSFCKREQLLTEDRVTEIYTAARLTGAQAPHS